MKKVIVYSTQFCPYCQSAKRLLELNQIPYEEIDLSNDYEKREEIQQKTGWMTVPMIFIGDEFVGGFDELQSLESNGQLEEKLKA